MYKRQKLLHINELELLAIIKVCKAFRNFLIGKMAQITTDNTTSIYYILNQGITHSPGLLYLVVDLWEWCLQYHSCLTALYIAGQDNNLADSLSCRDAQAHECKLDQSVFRQLCWKWGTPTLVLFAS